MFSDTVWRADNATDIPSVTGDSAFLEVGYGAVFGPQYPGAWRMDCPDSCGNRWHSTLMSYATSSSSSTPVVISGGPWVTVYPFVATRSWFYS